MPEIREETLEGQKLVDQLLAEEAMLAELQLMEALQNEEMHLAEMLAQLQFQKLPPATDSSPYTAAACDFASIVSRRFDACLNNFRYACRMYHSFHPRS